MYIKFSAGRTLPAGFGPEPIKGSHKVTRHQYCLFLAPPGHHPSSQPARQLSSQSLTREGQLQIHNVRQPTQLTYVMNLPHYSYSKIIMFSQKQIKNPTRRSKVVNPRRLPKLLLLSYCRHHGAYEGMVLCCTIPAHV
jgi:hypothetical protein